MRTSQQLRALHEQGLSLREPAAGTGSSYSAVRNHLLDAGTVLRRHAGRRRRSKQSALPAAMHTVTQAPPRPQRLDPKTRRRAARELRRAYEQGASLKELSNQSGRSPTWIRTLLLEAGATIRPRGGPRPGPPPALNARQRPQVGSGGQRCPLADLLLGRI
ncbi:helix-turn-helix domain-containing protein [Streptomyces violascens]|uniref:helix-turn-helix domain-containing protein n=1 Tax=Streptomyces violascens TaxID=67381 RepID=UPI0036BFB562